MAFSHSSDAPKAKVFGGRQSPHPAAAGLFAARTRLRPPWASVDRRAEAPYAPPLACLATGAMARSHLLPLLRQRHPRCRRQDGRWSWLLAVLLTSACSGCASLLTGGWATEDTEDLADPSPHTAVRTIQLEARWVRHPVDDPVVVEELWASVDEHSLPRDIRERLAANGLRAGLVSWPLPDALAERFAFLEEATTAEDQPADDDPLLPNVTRQSLRLLPGRPSEVVATPACPEMVVLEREGDRVCGTTFQHATAVFELTAEAAADGKTSVGLVPVIKHGDRRRQWIGEEGVFRLEAGQCRKHLKTLDISLELAADTMLVITAAGSPSSTVGDAFFRGRDLPRTPQQTLAIRPLTRTTDPLFTATSEGP